MIHQDCQCAACQQRADKPLTDSDIAAHQLLVEGFWKNKRIKELEASRDEWKNEAMYLRGLSAESVAGKMLTIVEQQRDDLLAAAENLVRVKGRHHTEQAYKQLEAAVAKVKEQK